VVETVARVSRSRCITTWTWTQSDGRHFGEVPRTMELCDYKGATGDHFENCSAEMVEMVYDLRTLRIYTPPIQHGHQRWRNGRSRDVSPQARNMKQVSVDGLHHKDPKNPKTVFHRIYTSVAYQNDGPKSGGGVSSFSTEAQFTGDRNCRRRTQNEFMWVTENGGFFRMPRWRQDMGRNLASATCLDIQSLESIPQRNRS